MPATTYTIVTPITFSYVARTGLRLCLIVATLSAIGVGLLVGKDSLIAGIIIALIIFAFDMFFFPWMQYAKLKKAGVRELKIIFTPESLLLEATGHSKGEISKSAIKKIRIKRSGVRLRTTTGSRFFPFDPNHSRAEKLQSFLRQHNYPLV